MKYSLIIAVLIVCAAGEAAGIDEAAIAEVKAGRQTVARAAWWGFDPADSTAALQAAIDSGARKVILEDLGAPWSTRPLELAGDQELALEPGVVLQAKRGAFKATGDCLLSASGKKNVRITGGPGASVRMWRGDYARAPYAKSEFRHAIAIKSCAGVSITGLSIVESGGDGIYLGVSRPGVTNTDVEIRDVVCDRNYRQGISVISAQRLLIVGTVLRGTSGTAPMAGIDFEPNKPTEKLVDCVMRDCLAENNAGHGYTFYLKNQSVQSAPISVRFENCRSVGNRVGFRYSEGSGNPQTCVKGTMDVIGCSFEGSQGAGIAVDGKPAVGLPMRFERCRVVNAGANDSAGAPIQLTSNADNAAGAGGVEFADCVVVDARDRRPLTYRDLAGGVKLAGVGGTLTVERAGRRTVYTLDRKLLEEWFPAQAFTDFPPFQVPARWAPASAADLGSGVPASAGIPPKGGTSKPLWACPVRLRERGEYLVWADAGQEVRLTLRLRRVGTVAAPKMPVTLIAPDGKSRKLPEMAAEGDKTYTFKAGETGACRIVCESGQATVQVAECSHRVCLYQERGRMHLLGSAGRLYFYVPAGVEEFAVRVGAGGEGENVKATVLDAGGKAVAEKDNIEGHQFLLARKKGAGAEIWSVKLEKPSRGGIEDYFVQLQGIAPVLATHAAALIAPHD